MWAGMDVTPGGSDESLVPAAQRLGQAVDIGKRVELLVETTCFTVFSYVAQVCISRQPSWARLTYVQQSNFNFKSFLYVSETANQAGWYMRPQLQVSQTRQQYFLHPAGRWLKVASSMFNGRSHQQEEVSRSIHFNPLSTRLKAIEQLNHRRKPL